MTPRNMPMIDHLLLNRAAWDASRQSVRRITSQPDQAGSECLRTMFNRQKGYPQRVIHNMSLRVFVLFLQMEKESMDR